MCTIMADEDANVAWCAIILYPVTSAHIHSIIYHMPKSEKMPCVAKDYLQLNTECSKRCCRIKTRMNCSPPLRYLYGWIQQMFSLCTEFIKFTTSLSAIMHTNPYDVIFES